MNWLDKLERKYGRHAIPNITRLMIMANLIGYALRYLYAFTEIDLMSTLQFSAPLILRGQIWRLVTWIFLPATSFGFMTLLFVICLLMLGDSLERWLGSFRMTIYFLGAILISDIGGLLVYLLFQVPVYLTLYYALFSMYLMLGLFLPDAEVRLYFVIPIKMKYMIWVYAIMFALEIFSNFQYGFAIGLALSAEMIFAIINLLVFVYSCKGKQSPVQRAKQIRRQQQYRQASRPVNPYGNAQTAAGGVPVRHKCFICGRTDVSNPELTFRYCSKCSGAREYCEDHLFSHQHIQ